MQNEVKDAIISNHQFLKRLESWKRSMEVKQILALREIRSIREIIDGI